MFRDILLLKVVCSMGKATEPGVYGDGGEMEDGRLLSIINGD